MKTLVESINESKKPLLTDIDRIYCEYLIKGIQKSNKAKAIKDLNAMLPTKAHFGNTDDFTTRDILTAYIEEQDNIPELLGDEDASTFYSYIMDVKLK